MSVQPTLEKPALVVAASMEYPFSEWYIPAPQSPVWIKDPDAKCADAWLGKSGSKASAINVKTAILKLVLNVAAIFAPVKMKRRFDRVYGIRWICDVKRLLPVSRRGGTTVAVALVMTWRSGTRGNCCTRPGSIPALGGV